MNGECKKIGRNGPGRARLGLCLSVAVCVWCCPVVCRAIEYTYNFTYAGTGYSNTVYCDDSLGTGKIKGVIVTFNYGANVYGNTAWRNFAKDRGLALLLMASQDTFGIPANTVDMTTVLNNTLGAASSATGHAELSATTLPLIFLGVSRGGTSGAINLGWSYGSNRTIACLAYHGNSFNYLTSATTTAAKAIPVLYPMAQSDSGPYRQTDIETCVRTNNATTLNGTIPSAAFGYRPKYGLYWTTTMQYGSSHASTGDDTYPLQWLGRVIDARYNASIPGTLNAITSPGSLDASYILTNGATSSAYFATCATSTFTQKDGNIWLPAGGASEWIAESTQPQIGVPLNLDTNSGPTYTAPDNILNRNFINTGTITFSGGGVVGLDNSGGGNPDYFLMSGGTVRVIHGATLRNGANQGGVWTNNKAGLYLDSDATFDMWNGNPVIIDALTGSGTFTISASSGVNWAGARSLTVGANNGSGSYSGVISGNSTVDGGSLSLTKIGTGTQTLSGPCSHNSSTSVLAGTLVLGGTLSATSSVEVASGATLQLAGGTLAAGSLHISSGGMLTGSGTVSGPVVNDGTVTLSSGTVAMSGTVTNNGTMRLTGGTRFGAGGSIFYNNGLLDIMTSTSPLSPNFVNHGIVLDRQQVCVKLANVRGGDFQVGIQSYSGHNYQLQRSGTLGTGASWANVGAAQAGTGLVLTFTDSGGASGTSRFYRIAVSP